jgi:hypothetical protein
VFHAALEAVLLGDASRFLELFTDDVAFSGPHLSVTSRAAVQAVLGVPETSMTDVGVVVWSMDAVGDKLMAEWRLDATFQGALLFDDSVLIEPTGSRVALVGVSVAEFRDRRICAFRHYFRGQSPDPTDADDVAPTRVSRTTPAPKAASR